MTGRDANSDIICSRHGGATALLYLFWIVATMVMVATQTLILIRRNEIIDHFDKHASFWRDNQAKNCKASKRVISSYNSAILFLTSYDVPGSMLQFNVYA